MQIKTIDNTTCWYNLDIQKSKTFKNLSDLHTKIIKNLINKIPNNIKTLIDLGCGSGKTSQIFNNYNYTGVDLSNVINNISKIFNPNLNFIKCDIINGDISFINKYDIVYMDGFIDVMQYPLQVLDKILKHCTKYVLLIKQEIINNETNVIKNSAYNGFTYHSEINRNDFNNILQKHNISIIKEVDAGIGIWKITKKRIKYPGKWRSFLLKRTQT